jgi:uncharacterized damage-inducible protein DinB
MDALTLLRDQAANANRILQHVFEPVTPEQASWRAPGSLANTIGATFTHVYYDEDQVVHDATGSPSVFEAGGWRDCFSFDAGSVWTYSGAFDPKLLREYANAVAAATSTYLENLSPGALEEEIETRRGPQPRISRLSIYLVIHKFQHQGEIAALLGCQGQKGLPF